MKHQIGYNQYTQVNILKPGHQNLMTYLQSAPCHTGDKLVLLTFEISPEDEDFDVSNIRQIMADGLNDALYFDNGFAVYNDQCSNNNDIFTNDGNSLMILDNHTGEGFCILNEPYDMTDDVTPAVQAEIRQALAVDDSFKLVIVAHN